jgi:hypothetical protein
VSERALCIFFFVPLAALLRALGAFLPARLVAFAVIVELLNRLGLVAFLASAERHFLTLGSFRLHHQHDLVCSRSRVTFSALKTRSSMLASRNWLVSMSS